MIANNIVVVEGSVPVAVPYQISACFEVSFIKKKREAIKAINSFFRIFLNSIKTSDVLSAWKKIENKNKGNVFNPKYPNKIILTNRAKNLDSNKNNPINEV